MTILQVRTLKLREVKKPAQIVLRYSLWQRVLKDGGLSELAHISVSEQLVWQWPSPPVLALAFAISQQGGGPEGPRSAPLVRPRGSSFASMLTPLPRAQPRDYGWLRGVAGRVRLREAPSTQLKLLLLKKGRMKTGQLESLPHLSSHTGGRCGPRPRVPSARPLALPAHRATLLAVELQHIHLLVDVLRPQRMPSSGLHVRPGAATQ